MTTSSDVVTAIALRSKKWGIRQIAEHLNINKTEVRAILAGESSRCHECNKHYWGTRKFCTPKCRGISNNAKSTRKRNAQKDLLRRADQAGKLMPILQSLGGNSE